VGGTENGSFVFHPVHTTPYYPPPAWSLFERSSSRRGGGYSRDSIHTNFILDDQLELLQKPYRRSDLLLKVREVIERAHR
jgi:hypothetical protein